MWLIYPKRLCTICIAVFCMLIYQISSIKHNSTGAITSCPTSSSSSPCPTSPFLAQLVFPTAECLHNVRNHAQSERNAALRANGFSWLMYGTGKKDTPANCHAIPDTLHPDSLTRREMASTPNQDSCNSRLEREKRRRGRFCNHAPLNVMATPRQTTNSTCELPKAHASLHTHALQHSNMLNHLQVLPNIHALQETHLLQH